MVSKQQDISSEISTCECSTVNSFGFGEKLWRYTEQEEVFSHWTLTNIHSKGKKKALIITLYFSPRNRRKETKHANAHGTKFGDKKTWKTSLNTWHWRTRLRVIHEQLPPQHFGAPHHVFQNHKRKAEERKDGRTLSLFSDPHASLLNSQGKHHLIVLVLDPQKNFRPSSLLQFASEKEKKKSCICRNCKQRRERSSHTTGLLVRLDG